MARVVDYPVPIPINLAWQKTCDFWKTQEMAVIRREDEPAGVLEIEQKISTSFYKMHYFMEFSPVNDGTTVVRVKIRLDLGGWLSWGGAQWLIANTAFKQWAAMVDSPYQNIAKGGLVKYIASCAVTLLVILVLYYLLNHG